MKLQLEIDCENAAFDDDAPLEIDCIVSGFLKRIKSEGIRGGEYKLYDTNGNRVGFAKFVE